ncbi:MAG TPA: DUF4202 domain-containing protein [Acidimicrobiales bacterium]|nr:DUF4202 domain-containing protein [Acidimicrobiales bacterium]
MDRFRHEQTIAAIDAANTDDPNTLVWLGEERPKELLHAELMTRGVRRLDPEPSETQLLAARAHHLRRWALPRDGYPEGRAGYLRWRKELNRRHQADVAAILADLGYDPIDVARVQEIVGKVGLATDPQVQTHEDALCLVFLQTQFTGLADRLGDERTVEVLRRTLAKMSPRGRSEALELGLTPRERALVERALG